MVIFSNNSLEKPKQARIKYQNISEGQFSGEVFVTMHTAKGLITGIFPSSSIDKASETIISFVVGEEGDLYLVDLPTYTFTTGSKAWFPKNAVKLEGTLV